MRSIIRVDKQSYGYVVHINGNSRGFTRVLGSQHPKVAAEAALAAWKENCENPDGVTVEVPQEVEAIIRARGPIPWTTSQ
jgi:hypothetical protein